MITEALKVMLFGMLGIFFVMGLIIISIQLLSYFQRDKPQEEQKSQESQGDSD